MRASEKIFSGYLEERGRGADEGWGGERWKVRWLIRNVRSRDGDKKLNKKS